MDAETKKEAKKVAKKKVVDTLKHAGVAGKDLKKLLDDAGMAGTALYIANTCIDEKTARERLEKRLRTCEGLPENFFKNFGNGLIIAKWALDYYPLVTVKLNAGRFEYSWGAKRKDKASGLLKDAEISVNVNSGSGVASEGWIEPVGNMRLGALGEMKKMPLEQIELIKFDPTKSYGVDMSDLLKGFNQVARSCENQIKEGRNKYVADTVKKNHLVTLGFEDKVNITKVHENPVATNRIDFYPIYVYNLAWTDTDGKRKTFTCYVSASSEYTELPHFKPPFGTLKPIVEKF